MTVCRPDSWVCLGETTNAALPSTIFAVDDLRVTIANDGASAHLGENKRPGQGDRGCVIRSIRRYLYTRRQ